MSTRANSCPCCGRPLLRHVRHGEVYWFCQTCWQEVPLLKVSQFPHSEESTIKAIPQPVVK